MKNCSKFNLFILIIAAFISKHKVSQAAEDGLLLGVPTTVNTSSQVVNTEESTKQDNKQNVNIKEENTIEEIHSSFDDAPMSHDETKNKDVLQSEPTTLQLQYQHVNIATELSESGHAAVVYTLVDSVTSELQKQAASVAHEPENSTGPVTIPLTLSDAPSNDTQYVVRAEPRVESAPPTPPAAQESEAEVGAAVVGPDGAEEMNDTLSAGQPQEPPPTHQEDIPSFSEWAQKQLAEAEKKKGENATGGSVNNNAGLKVRHSKNYASPDCGAKVVGSNPEAVSAGAVLSSSRDEYLLNTCNARTWFIVELCEAIQPKKIEMANFELFSSSPKEFSIYLSDRYPTRDWALAGRFMAHDERNLQAFNLSDTAHFGKYVKVEVHSHYGQEHYCPISLLRVYGTSEIEVLDTVDEGDAHHAHELGVDDDDDEVVAGEKGEEPRNLFGSARDAVLSIVKKAAEALAKTPEEAKNNSSAVIPPGASRGIEEPCVTPSHIVVCVNCSDDFYHRVYELMSCRSQSLSQLLSSEFVKQTMTSSELCAARGLDLRVGAPYPPSPRSLHARPRPIHYLQALLPDETLAALCNQLAVVQKKVVLNISYDQPADTENHTILPSAVVPEDTLVLPDTASCPVESNVSEEKLATRPPYEPAHATPLPIRPSRTVREEELPLLSPSMVEEVEANVTVEAAKVEVEVVQPADNSSSNNSLNGSGSVSAPSAGSTENLTLVVEDVVSLDSLFSELEQAVVPSPRVPPAPQKESVFVRLANRIKALERNMSLSGQYLEELSRRYKRQVEEMQKALVGAGEERRRWEERDSVRLEQVSQLAQQVETLTHAVKGLMEERDSWQHKATVMSQHALMVVVEVIVFTVVLYMCRWLPDMEVSNRRISMAWRNNKSAPAQQPRRRSLDQAAPSAPSKKRRPSEEALVIAGNTHQELLIPDALRKISKGETRRQRRKRRRELTQYTEPEDKPSLLDRNCTESVKPWWEEETFVPTSSVPPPPPARAEVLTAPRFVQTAVAQRQDRIAVSRSTSEASDKESKPFLKKAGPLKKIVKKFF